MALPWERLDWRELTAAEQEARLEEYLAADRARGFDPARLAGSTPSPSASPAQRADPLLRLALIRLAPQTYQCVWSMHHLLLDGWSMQLLLAEAFGAYQARLRGHALQLPAPRPFQEYVAWLGAQDGAATEAYWRRTLAGFGAPTPLPAGDVSPATDTPAAPDAETPRVEAPRGEAERRLSPATTESLQALAQRHQVTLSTVVQGAWALLLGRHSGLAHGPEGDAGPAGVVFGATVSGRPTALPGVEEMVGIFINTLPVRVSLPAGEGVVPWLRSLQAAQVERGQYEHSALVQVQGWSNLPRGRPLFESIVVVENYPLERPWQEQVGAEGGAGVAGAATLEVDGVRTFDRTHYPLELVVYPGAELGLQIGYDGARYSAPAVERLLEHLRTLLEGIAADPDVRLDDLPLLPPAERARLLTEWGTNAVPYPRGATVHHLFAAQAARAPADGRRPGRPRVPHLRGAGGPGQPPGAPPLVAGGGPRDAGGAVPRPLRRGGGGHPGGAQGGGRLRAPGPRLPARPPGLHAGGRWRGGSAHQ